MITVDLYIYSILDICCSYVVLYYAIDIIFCTALVT